MGRKEPLRIFGPAGTSGMAAHIHEAYIEDIRYRIYGSEPGNDTGHQVEVKEFDAEGMIYQDSLIRVEAFPVTHGSWPNAFGFRFTTADRVIVVSGDTRPDERLARYASGADILLHEVYYQKGWESKTDAWKAYHREHHTSAVELGGIAVKTNPRLLVLYHILFWGGSEEDLQDEINSSYRGKVIPGRDLDIF